MAEPDTELSEGVEVDISRPSTLDNAEMLRVFKADFREDRQHSSNWRTCAKDDFGFVAGDQWTTDEKSQLKDALRPEIVFNRALTIIKAVAGFEINGRHEIQYLPRTLEDAALNEVLTGASKWMADECDGEDEESEAFQDMTICGMGWCENRMDYEIDPHGRYEESQIDPLEMYWHFKARKKNLVDAARMWRLRKMSVSEAKGLFPGKTRQQLDASWAAGDTPNEPQKTVEQKRVRDENVQDIADRNEVHILERQWYEREPMWLVADPATDSQVELTDEKYKLLIERGAEFGIEFKAVQIYRRRYKRAFIGAEVLESGDGPLPDQFSYVCITGQLDKVKGVWFGLIRIMRDPAKWANKWLSQTLHIMNSNAKGGILAEADAFEDQQQAEDTWARPESITWVKKGALGDPATGKGAKWVPKPQTQFPQGFVNLLEFAISSLRDVTGINLELLGQKDIMQPGVLEAQRKQAGMTVLATMFDSLRRARKQVGRIRLYFIQTYMSDGRLIRITGPEGAKVIPLLKDKTSGQYDVVVDDTPTSPNQKQANWAIVAPMIPMFKEQLAAEPALLIEILRYSPLPSRLVSAIETIVSKPPSEDVQQERKLLIAGKVAEVKKDESTANLNNAKAQAAQNDSGGEQADPLGQHLDNIKKGAEIETERARTQEVSAEARSADAEARHRGIRSAIDMLMAAAEVETMKREPQKATQ